MCATVAKIDKQMHGIHFDSIYKEAKNLSRRYLCPNFAFCRLTSVCNITFSRSHILISNFKISKALCIQHTWAKQQNISLLPSFCIETIAKAHIDPYHLNNSHPKRMIKSLISKTIAYDPTSQGDILTIKGDQFDLRINKVIIVVGKILKALRRQRWDSSNYEHGGRRSKMADTRFTTQVTPTEVQVHV